MQKEEFEKLGYPEIVAYLPKKLAALGIKTIPELAKAVHLPPEFGEERVMVNYFKEMGWAWLSTKVRELELAESYKRQM